MDPNATLSRIYALMADIKQPDVGVDPLEAANELVDNLDDLDTWLKAGGCMPDEWADAEPVHKPSKHDACCTCGRDWPCPEAKAG